MDLIGETVELRSDPAELGRVRDFVSRWARRCELSPDDAFRACLVTTEAVTNSMRHGRAEDDGERPIRVTCRADGGALVVEVGDRGTFQTPPLPGDEDGGRGLVLIRGLSSSFNLQTGEDGTRLVMRVGTPAVALREPAGVA